MESAVQEQQLSEQIVVDRSPELARSSHEAIAPTDWRYALATNIPRRVKMTQEIIDSSVRGDGAACAFARAWKAECPDDEPHIEGEQPYIVRRVGGQEWQQPISFPPAVVEWIGRFDRGEPVEPLTLDMW